MDELLYGSPAHRPLGVKELFEWYALITVVEPEEREAQRRAST